MTDASHALRYVEFAAYIVVAVVAALRWFTRRGAARAWLAATFGLLGLVLVAGELMPTHARTSGDRLAQKVLVAALLLFPYFLYRFMATFERPPRLLDHVAYGLVAAVLVTTALVHRFPEPGQSRSATFSGYVALVLVEWTFLSAVVSVRFWRGGRGQARVARNRMRMLSLGATALAAALVVAGVSPSGEASATTIVVQAIAIVSALLFLAGFAPPRTLLRLWRAREVEAIQGAVVAMARATSPREVVEGLLPRLVRLCGAQGAAVFREHGEELGRTGVTRPVDADAAVVTIAPDVHQIGDDHLVLDVPGGRLDLWTNAYTPYFGRDDIDLFRNVATLVLVTLERTYAHAREVAVRESLDDAQRVAHLGSWRRDLRTGRYEVSDEMYRLYGLDAPAVPQPPEYFSERIHPDDRVRLERESAEARAAGRELSVEYRIVRPDGAVRWLLGKWRAITDDAGEAIALVGTCQDITDRRRMDDLRRDFVSNAAHELRTPLTTVAGMASLLATERERLSPEQMAHAFEALGRQGERARELVTSLLDLSRLDAGSVPVQLQPVAVGSVVAHALETAPPPVTARVVLDCPEDAVAVADPARLQEVVVNLLTNAYRHGGPGIVVAARRDGANVVLSVTDDGNGVPPHRVDDVFEPFSRGDAPRSPGSGLGLAISRRLASALGGTLAYEPVSPHGARFLVRLRAAR